MKSTEDVVSAFSQRQTAKIEDVEKKKQAEMERLAALRKVVSAAEYRIIVDPIEPETESEGGLKYTQETIDAQQYLRYYGQVVDIGPLCFSQEKFKLPDGTRIRGCEIGDWIVYGQHTGVDICVREGKNVRRMRAINDDNVLAVIHDLDQIKIPLV